MRMRVLLVVIAVVFGTQTVGATEEARNTITVVGTGKVTRKPDVAYVTLYVKGDGILMTDAVQTAKGKTGEIEKALKEKYKEIKDLAVADIEIGEKRKEYWRSDEKDEIARPEVVKRLRITLPPNAQLAYEVIDTALRAGAIMQIPSSVHYSDEIRSVVLYGLVAFSESENQAKQKAMENAKDNAEKTAALVGEKAGDVVSVGCSSSSSWSHEIQIMRHEADLPTKYLGLDPHRIEVSHCVSVTYELLKK
jgi:uncharacterized protein YggE